MGWDYYVGTDDEYDGDGGGDGDGDGAGDYYGDDYSPPSSTGGGLTIEYEIRGLGSSKEGTDGYELVWAKAVEKELEYVTFDASHFTKNLLQSWHDANCSYTADLSVAAASGKAEMYMSDDVSVLVTPGPLPAPTQRPTAVADSAPPLYGPEFTPAPPTPALTLAPAPPTPAQTPSSTDTADVAVEWSPPATITTQCEHCRTQTCHDIETSLEGSDGGTSAGAAGTSNPFISGEDAYGDGIALVIDACLFCELVAGREASTAEPPEPATAHGVHSCSYSKQFGFVTEEWPVCHPRCQYSNCTQIGDELEPHLIQVL
jgi:hypothetical protein